MNGFRSFRCASRSVVVSGVVLGALLVQAALVGVVALSVVGCKDESASSSSNARSAPPPPPPPPPAASAPGATKGVCASGGGSIADATTAPFFSRTLEGYCIDPATETVVYGPKEKHSMDEVCTTAFDGECEVYKTFGLARVVFVHYVDGAGGTGTMDVYLSKFGDVGGAYGLFTKRVVADRDPADPSAPRVIEAGGAAALGTGRGYVWKGPYLAELQYSNENETPEQIANTGERLLTALAKDLGAKVIGSTEKPNSAALLPSADRIPGGIFYHPKGFLGLGKLGDAAVGYYKKGTKRYRLVAMTRATPELAKTDAALLRSLKGAAPVADVGEEASAVTIVDKSDPRSKADYLFARKGNTLVGVGDEDQAAGDADSMRLAKEEKYTLLKEWLGSSTLGVAKGAASPAPSGAAAPSSSARPKAPTTR